MIRFSDSVRLRRALLILCIVSGVAAVASLLDMLRSRREAADWNALSAAAQHLVATLTDVETGYRGYVIVGSPAYLEPYRAAVSAIDADVERLRRSGERARIDVEPTIAPAREKLAFAAAVIEARGRTFDEARSLVESGRGKALMDKVRSGADG